jgi:hypothetical protein
MTFFWKHVTRQVFISLSVVISLTVLAACGGGSSTTSSTPTPSAAVPSPTAALVGMQTFTGNGFSISYPQTWQKSTSNTQTVFEDSTLGNAFTIVQTADPGGAASADTLASASIQAIARTVLKNAKTESVTPSTSINGVTWSQRAVTGDVVVGSQTVPAKLVLLVAVHPASAVASQAFQLFYVAPTFTFDQVNQTIFQPMLQSFKFTS